MSRLGLTRGKGLTAAVVACSMAAVVSACGSESGGSRSSSSGGVKLPDKFVIGATLPLTGAAASYGATMRNGMDIAINQINAEGGIDGVKVEANYQDFGAGDPAKGVGAAKQLLANDVVAITTCYIAVPLAQEPVVTQAKVPLFIPCEAENSLLNKDWIYHVTPTFDQEMETLEKHISSTGAKKLTILTGDTTSKDVSNALVENWKKLSGQPAQLVLLDANTTDPTPEVSDALSTNPDAMIVAVVGTLGQTVVEKLAARGVKVPLYGGIASSAYVKQIQQGKLDWSFTSGVFDNSPAFLKAFKAGNPKGEPQFWNSTFYTSVMIIKQAIEAAIKAGEQPNGEAVKGQLDKIKSFDGCCGQFSFGPGHSAPGTYAIMQIKGGAAPKKVAQLAVDPVS